MQQEILQGKSEFLCPRELPSKKQLRGPKWLFACGSMHVLWASKDGGPAATAKAELASFS